MIEILREHRGGGAIQTVKVGRGAAQRVGIKKAETSENMMPADNVHVSSAAVQLPARVPGKVRSLSGEPEGVPGAVGVPVILGALEGLCRCDVSVVTAL